MKYEKFKRTLFDRGGGNYEIRPFNAHEPMARLVFVNNKKSKPVKIEVYKITKTGTAKVRAFAFSFKKNVKVKKIQIFKNDVVLFEEKLNLFGNLFTFNNASLTID
jgi:hypothetical protein